MLKQNTAEWLQIRRSKVGASDAPIIMLSSPYATPYQLWQRKLGLIDDQITTPAMQRGHDLEEKARHELERKTGLLFAPQVKFHKEYTWMMASLDAMDIEGKCIAEIKCPKAEDHSIAKAGKIPDKYFPQLQHQMEVCEVEECYYFSFDGTHGELVKVFRDDKYIKKMIEKEKIFFENMMTFIPPELCDRDYVENSSQQWLEAANQWKKLKEEMSPLQEKEEQLKSLLVSLCPVPNVKGAGIKISKVSRKGNIEYSLIPELKQIDLEKYRKKSSEYWKISEYC